MLSPDLASYLRKMNVRLRRTQTKIGPLVLESTWTPTYTGQTTAGVTTYVTQIGYWTRIGRLIHFQGRLEWSAATGTGNALFSLPFTTANVTNLFGAGSVDNTNVTFANGTPQMLLQPNVSAFILRSPLTNVASAVVQMEAAGIVNFAGLYLVVA